MTEKFDHLKRPLVEPPRFDSINNVTQPWNLAPPQLAVATPQASTAPVTSAQEISEKALEAQKPLMEAQVEGTGLDNELKRQQLIRIQRNREGARYRYDGKKGARGKASARREPGQDVGTDNWWAKSRQRNVTDAQNAGKQMRTAVAQRALALRAQQQAGNSAAGQPAPVRQLAVQSKRNSLLETR